MTNELNALQTAAAVAQLDDMAVAFGLLGRLFWEEPQDGLVADLAGARGVLLREPFPAGAASAAAGLVRALDAYAADPLAQMHLLRQDRTWLFYQVGYSRTSPYESVYRTPDRTLFGPSTAAVKDTFARHGLSFARRGSEPCDHFALECMYVARIARAGTTASVVGDDAAAAGAVAEIRRFLGEHLLVFGPIYLANVARQARTWMYRSAAELGLGVLSWAAELVGAQAVETLDPAGFSLHPRMAR